MSVIKHSLILPVLFLSLVLTFFGILKKKKNDLPIVPLNRFSPESLFQMSYWPFRKTTNQLSILYITRFDAIRSIDDGEREIFPQSIAVELDEEAVFLTVLLTGGREPSEIWVVDKGVNTNGLYSSLNGGVRTGVFH